MAAKKVSTPDPIVTLNDTYQVTLDSKCLILKKKATSDDKDLSKEEQKEGVKILGYYSTWEGIGSSLVKEITREKVKSTKNDILTISEYIDIVKETNKEVSNMFKNIDEAIKVTKKNK